MSGQGGRTAACTRARAYVPFAAAAWAPAVPCTGEIPDAPLAHLQHDAHLHLPPPFFTLTDYAHYLGDAAMTLASSPPALPGLLLVAGMCAALSAAALWMQSVQLWVPLVFYRTEASKVRERQHS